MIRRAVLAVLGIVIFVPAISQAATPAGKSTRGCPSAKACGLYVLDPARWPASRGVTTISFLVYPASQAWLPPADAMNAVRAAAATWSAADPSVRFMIREASFAPCTSIPASAVPAVACGDAIVPPGDKDGLNEIAWTSDRAVTLATTTVRISKNTMQEADIRLNALAQWSWTPCGGNRGACTTGPAFAGAFETNDLQAVITHEIGHVLGLKHVPTAGSELTMFGSTPVGERKKSTLAFGDVLGVRAAYPTKARMPAIQVP